MIDNTEDLENIIFQVNAIKKFLSRKTFQPGYLKRPINFEEEGTIQDYWELSQIISNKLDDINAILLTVLSVENETNLEENPYSSTKITDPTKFAKKTNWWKINLLDASGKLIKSVVVSYRTKTEAKLFVRGTIGKWYGNEKIETAILEGPFKSMTEASSHASTV